MPAWLPTSGLVRMHHDYGVFCTDAPPIYHVASILTTLSSAVADTAVLVFDSTEHPLNLWTMIVGASSSDRKTTSTRLAVDRLEMVDRQRVKRIFGSPEGFVEQLAQDPTSLLYIPEGAAFFEQQQASYWRHAKGMFMDLYDWTPEFHRQLARGKSVTIIEPRLSILSAVARPLLDHYSRNVDWLGGFLPRFMMIMGTKEGFRPWQRDDHAKSSAVEQDLYEAYNTHWGAIAVSSAAQRVIENFMVEIHMDQNSFHQNLHPALNRLTESAIRLSALYEISLQIHKPKMPLMVSARAAQHAVALCRASRDQALRTLLDTTQNPGDEHDLAKVERLVRDCGIRGIRRMDLLRRTHMTSDRLDKLMITLLDAEMIVVEERPTGKPGRPPAFYVHAEAKNDAVREVRNQTIDPEPNMRIEIDGDIDLSGLPMDDTDDGETGYLTPYTPRWDDDDDDLKN